ncbi:MAG: Jag N-terminal domain-containing protein [Chitinivibrionia bacterium]|nr:Jag N-terminal domain-containing protein [Chitinivibrionia bacterium]
MAHSVETSGKTIENALEKALKELKAAREEVDIEILPEASKGFLGLFGTKVVSIRVTRREPAAKEENMVVLREIINKVMSLMGIEFKLSIEENPDTTFVNIESTGLDGLLIGRRGETLASLQHVINRLFTSKTGQHSKITVDVGGYVRRKHRLLVEKAKKVAEKVKETGKEIDFEPLKAADRRIVHLAISEMGGVSTYTIGDGLLRKVVVTPKSNDAHGRAAKTE